MQPGRLQASRTRALKPLDDSILTYRRLCAVEMPAGEQQFDSTAFE